MTELNEYVRPDAQKQLHQDGDVVYESDRLIYNPYNPVNKEIPRDVVNAILTRYNVPTHIHNFTLYKRAFVHQSYVVRDDISEDVFIVDKPENCLSLRSKSNERLEFLGDGVLEMVVKYYLYRRFPKANEGFMTEKKISIVKNETIGKLAYDMGLAEWILLSRGAEEKGMRTNMKKLGCLFEAFVGALFLDFNKIHIKDEDGWFGTNDDDSAVFVCGPGFQMAQVFIENVLETHLDWDTILRKDENFKNILQVKIQQAFSTTPVYRILDKEDGEFTMGVFLCLGQLPHQLANKDAHSLSRYSSLDEIRETYYIGEAHVEDGFTPQEKMMVRWKPAWIFLGQGIHKVKKKAEQMACYDALEQITQKLKDKNEVS